MKREKRKSKMKFHVLWFMIFILKQNKVVANVIFGCDNACKAQKFCEDRGKTLLNESQLKAVLENLTPDACKDGKGLFWLHSGECKTKMAIWDNSEAEISYERWNRKLQFACLVDANKDTTKIKRRTTHQGYYSKSLGSTTKTTADTNVAEKTAVTGNAFKPEFPPEQKMQQLLQDLGKHGSDVTAQIREYESSIVADLSILSPGTKFSTDAVDVLVQGLNLAETKMESQYMNTEVIGLDFNGSVTKDDESYVDIPLNLIRESAQVKNVPSALKVVIAKWKKKGNLASIDPDLKLPENGAVLSVSYFADRNASMSLPVSYVVNLQHDYTAVEGLLSNELLQSIDGSCAWLDTKANRWSKSGCVAVKSNISTAREVRCECQHTTTFAVLLSINKTVTVPATVGTIASAFEVTSVVCLVLTIIFLITARHGAGIDSTQGPNGWGMRTNRTNSQVSLCISLACMHSVILWSDMARSNYDLACVAVTALTHYFLLASAFWSFNEGLGIFIKMIPNLTMGVQYRRLTVVQVIIGWIFPLAISLTCVIYGINEDMYMDIAKGFIHVQRKVHSKHVHTPKYEECWLSSRIIWASLAPLLLVVGANVVMLFYITRGVVKMNRSVSTYQADAHRTGRSDQKYGSGEMLRVGGDLPLASELPSVTSVSSGATVSTDTLTRRKKGLRHMVSATRSFAILMPVLSIPWLLTILSNIPGANVVLQSAHVLINGLQGLQIFLLYCVVSKVDWRRLKRKWKNSRLNYILNRYQNRKESMATNTSRMVSYGTRNNHLNIDINHNGLNPAWQVPRPSEPNAQYHTLKSRNSRTSTMSRDNPVFKNRSPARNASYC